MRELEQKYTTNIKSKLYQIKRTNFFVFCFYDYFGKEGVTLRKSAGGIGSLAKYKDNLHENEKRRDCRLRYWRSRTAFQPKNDHNRKKTPF